MMLKQPFEVPFSEVLADPAPYIEAVLGCLASEFWVMPKGDGFVDYPTFDSGYEKLKQATKGFREIATERVLSAVIECPISFVVLRSMLGFTPPEWAYITAQRKGVEIPQGYARSIDRNIRLQPVKPIDAKNREIGPNPCHDWNGMRIVERKRSSRRTRQSSSAG